MKTKNMIWAALSMTAALVMTACTNDDNIVETPAAPQAEVKTIPYTVTVNDGAATNRAAVDSDNKTLRFATGDKLYITGTNVKGVLEITSGVGETTGAIFSGDLTYTGEGSPASDLTLTATLVSAQQTDGSEVSVDANGAVTVNYPTTAYCDDVTEAVQKYSNLTGTSTYSTKSFTLTQNTAFLNFVITFEDGTTTDTELSAVVSNGGSAIATANVTTTTESEKVVAKFVLPVYSSTTTLSSANVKMGDKEAISFGASQTLTGKVYNVKKTQAAAGPTAYTLAESTVGMIVGSDGKAYAAADKDNLPSGVTAVAMVAYKSATAGSSLAIALADEGSIMNWATAKSTCEGKTAIGGNSWKLPSQDEWKQMFGANGGNNESYTGLNTAITTAGGTALQEYDDYWSSTPNGEGNAWRVRLYDGDAHWAYGSVDVVRRVRACLAF